jgi:hypothetical protein
MENEPNYPLPRKHPRFKALQRTLVLLPQGPEALPYHIIDISEGGLSFRYLGKKIKPTRISPINLYHEHELIVEALPVKTVSDYQLSEGIVPVRRGSLCFESLSMEQRNKLSSFVEKFTEHSY